MRLLDLLHRACPPAPWAEGDKIPWDEPGFSARMLAWHLDQTHDLASRRSAVIDTQVAWLEGRFLAPRSRVLDLGCGPGLYLQRLAEGGHHGVGLDFSPAAVDHARAQAAAAAWPLEYRLADLRTADFGAGFDLVLLLYGELNVFRPVEAASIVARAHAALRPGGHLVIEVHTAAEVRRQGAAAPWWQALESGLFSPTPHLWLQEQFWDEATATATTRYLIVDLADGHVTPHASTMQAYHPEQYEALLTAAGFGQVTRFDSLGTAPGELPAGLEVYAAAR